MSEHIHHHHDEHCDCGHDHHEHHHHDEHCDCGHDHHEHHHHDEHCDCGHDHHEHHHHDEHCDCGHDHHEHHHHDEHCDCGHDHHEHDEHCDCGCHDHEEEQNIPGKVYTKVRLHDDAKVVSGNLTVIGSYEKVREGLHRGLTEFAAKVAEKGGVVGHIKASAEIKNVEMFSVTDVDVMIKTAPEQEISIILAAIVFFVSAEEAEEWGRAALEAAL